MSLLSCLLGPSKWLTDIEKLLIFMRIFLLILAFVESLNRQDYCNFYVEMVSFVNLANEYLSKYDELTEDQKKRYQRSLHEILKRMSHNQTYIIGGTWGQSWTISELYAFYQTVKNDLKQNPYPGNNGIGQRYDLPPAFSYSGSSDPLIREKIHDELFRIGFHLPDEMSRTFQIILKSGSKSEPLNVPPPVVSPLFVDSSANWTDLGAAISALNLANSLATPRDTVRSPTAFDDSTPVGVISTHSEICTPCALCTPSTPRTPRLPGFSKWLLQALLSQEFLQFLQQQSHQSSSQQLKQMFRVMQMFFTRYGVELFYYQNPQTIHSFFQALHEYAFMRIALVLYYRKPLDGWMDFRIVTDSNEEDQKRFYEYLKMMIHFEVWLCNNSDDKPEFSAKCDGKRWRFDESNDSFDIFNLPEPSTIGELPPMA